MQEVRERHNSKDLDRWNDEFVFENVGNEDSNKGSSFINPEEEDDRDFSFCVSCSDLEPPISADDIFEGGRIRPLHPLFGSHVEGCSPRGELTSDMIRPLKKVYMEKGPEGEFCEWDGRSHRRSATVVDASPATCRKSNSTGFSRLMRLRELVIRSHSDGKDAFVFLNQSRGGKGKNGGSPEMKNDESKGQPEIGKKMETMKGKEEHYKRVKEVSKRATYLPYRVGVFSDVNAFSRNVLPF